MVDGKLALISKGITFVMKQMAAGIVAFAPVFNCELNGFREVLLTHQSDEVDSEEGDVEGDGYHGDGDDDDEELHCSDEENVSSNGRDKKLSRFCCCSLTEIDS